MAEIRPVSVQKVLAVLRKADLPIHKVGRARSGYEVRSYLDGARITYFGNGYANTAKKVEFLTRAQLVLEGEGIVTARPTNELEPTIICTGITES